MVDNIPETVNEAVSDALLLRCKPMRKDGRYVCKRIRRIPDADVPEHPLNDEDATADESQDEVDSQGEVVDDDLPSESDEDLKEESCLIDRCSVRSRGARKSEL